MENWIMLVKQQMRTQRITQEGLALRVGVAQSTVSQWVREHARPSLDMQNAVLRALGIADFEFATVLRTQETRAVYASSLPEGALPGEGYRYPCIQWHELASPELSSATWMFSDYRARGRAFWLPVANEAMCAPQGWSVAQGGWILVDPGRACAAHALVVVETEVGQGAIFRQWVEEAGRCYLRALNPNWPVLEVGPNVHLYGVVVAATYRFADA